MRACVHAQVLCILRVSVFVSLYFFMWFVSCLSSVLVSLFMLYLYSFRSQLSVVGGFLFTLSAGTSLDTSLSRVWGLQRHCGGMGGQGGSSVFASQLTYPGSSWEQGSHLPYAPAGKLRQRQSVSVDRKGAHGRVGSTAR